MDSQLCSRTLALIPAKGASTRLPRKNLAPLDGSSLLERAILQAQDCTLFDAIAVSSEDDEILATAAQLRVDHVIVRPEALARDPAGVNEVALHALESLREAGSSWDAVCILLPTSPLRSSVDIHGAHEVWVESRPDTVISVSAFSHTPFAGLVNERGELHPLHPKQFGKKSQDVPEIFRPNGAVMFLDIKRFQETMWYLSPPLRPYIMPANRSIDVDSELDLAMASLLLRSSLL